jgi:hypothetical protein
MRRWPDALKIKVLHLLPQPGVSQREPRFEEHLFGGQSQDSDIEINETLLKHRHIAVPAGHQDYAVGRRVMKKDLSDAIG